MELPAGSITPSSGMGHWNSVPLGMRGLAHSMAAGEQDSSTPADKRDR